MPPDLAAQCQTALAYVRTLPDDLQHALAERVAADVAEPLATAVRGQAFGPYGPRVQVKVTAGLDEPTLLVGGQSQVFSGGAAGVDVFYGNEFGGGKRRNTYTAQSRKGHRFTVHNRHTTRQFRMPPRPFVFPTFDAEADNIDKAWLGILDDLGIAWDNGGDSGG